MSTQLSQIAKKAKLDRKARFTAALGDLAGQFLFPGQSIVFPRNSAASSPNSGLYFQKCE